MDLMVESYSRKLGISYLYTSEHQNAANTLESVLALDPDVSDELHGLSALTGLS